MVELLISHGIAGWGLRLEKEPFSLPLHSWYVIGQVSTSHQGPAHRSSQAKGRGTQSAQHLGKESLGTEGEGAECTERES